MLGMEGADLETFAEDFRRDVEKRIVTEAPASAWSHPHVGDAVALEVLAGSAGEGADPPELRVTELRCWRVGSGTPHLAGGVEIDRCVRTMRCGEVCAVKAREDEAAQSALLRLKTIETVDDLTGDRRLVRTTLSHGAGAGGMHPPSLRPGTEMKVRFSWRAAHDTAPGSDVPEMPVATEVCMSCSTEGWSALVASREFGDLVRGLLRRHGGTVRSRAPEATAAVVASPVLRVVRSGREVFVGAATAAGLVEAVAACGPEAAPGACGRPPRETLLRIPVVERCECAAEDWIPGDAALRVLSGVRPGSRCLARLAPDLAYGEAGKPELGVPPNTALEYDIEVLELTTLEEVTLDSQGRAMKKTIKDGEGYDRPSEGAEVRVRLEARDDHSGAALLEEQEVTFLAGLGRYCSAVEETVLTMKKGEACEVRCDHVDICTDTELGLRPTPDAAVVIVVELLDFSAVNMFSAEEPERVKHCTMMKEAGSRFFQTGSTRLALKRYHFVTTSLAYTGSWKDDSARDAAEGLRRACHLNSAACLLKLERWQEAEMACGMVLREDPGNVKALFRRGRALIELQEYREAEKSLRKTVELDRKSKEAAQLLAKAKQLLRAELEQSRKMLSRMAQGITKSEEEEEVAAQAAAAASADLPPPAPPTAPPPAEAESAEDDSIGGSGLVLLGVSAAIIALGGVLFMRWRGAGAYTRYRWLS